MLLEGRQAIVTGGPSGIGKATGSGADVTAMVAKDTDAFGGLDLSVNDAGTENRSDSSQGVVTTDAR